MNEPHPGSATFAGPLQGVRVLDLSAVLSGPMATAMLGDQGAQVIKIEPLTGDTSRRVGPAKGDMSAMFIAVNRGKQSVAVDLKSEAGREVVRKLALWADVLVENFRPGTLERLQLSPAALAALNPRLISLSISGFGPTGPYAGARVYDAVIQAVSGVAASHRDKATNEPTLLSTAVCDKLTALQAAQAITAALFARERDGRGRHIQLNMLDAALAFQWPDAMYNHLFMDEPPVPFPEMGAMLKPWRTSDGFVATMSPQADEFAALCAGFGQPELVHDPRFATAATRTRHTLELRALLEPFVATQPTEPLVKVMQEAGAPIGKVNERSEVLTDAQVLHNGCLAEVPHGDLGRVRLALGAAHFDGKKPTLPDPAPGLGEHTEAVLKNLGFDAAAVVALRRAGVIKG
jgi:crotonobetainyl-CoA:carnitine CoA-transferase CaiB-like acyl-CoA transferase